MSDPDIPAEELRLHLGEMHPQEVAITRAAIRWANATRTGNGIPDSAFPEGNPVCGHNTPKEPISDE